MSTQGDFAPFLEMDYLRVMVAQPSYLLAMNYALNELLPPPP